MRWPFSCMLQLFYDAVGGSGPLSSVTRYTWLVRDVCEKSVKVQFECFNPDGCDVSDVLWKRIEQLLSVDNEAIFSQCFYFSRALGELGGASAWGECNTFVCGHCA